jgi:hypothetical protein
VEHDPEEIWQQTQAVVQEAMQAGGLHPEVLAGIGITNQRETAVILAQENWKADSQRDRLARHASRSGSPGVRSQRRKAALSIQDRPAPFHLLQRPQNSLDS